MLAKQELCSMTLTNEIRAKIARTYWAGATPTEVGKEFGVSVPHVLMISKRYDRRNHELRRQRPNPPRKPREKIESRRELGGMLTASVLYIDEDARKLAALIPRDTRTLTAMLLGDPLPGRSALDKLSRPAR